jgi:hypothetical protein
MKDTAVEKIYAQRDTEQEQEKERKKEINFKAYIVYEQ